MMPKIMFIRATRKNLESLAAWVQRSQSMALDTAAIRQEVWFSGHVQGVGFRYQTRQVSMEFDVSGTVQNLLDGRVHLVAEGEGKEVTAFIDEVSHQMSSYIKDVETSEVLDPSGLSGFSII